MDTNHINFLQQQKEEMPHTSKRKKWSFLLLIIIIGIICVVGYVSANKIKNTDPLAYDPVTLEPKEPKNFLKKITYLIFKRDTKLEGQKNDRVNILLLGMGGAGHDGPFLTDTIMIASIRPSTGNVALISIPRDLGAEIPGYGIRKINHANAYGELKEENWGAAFATEVIADTFDIDIPYYIRLDFQAFEEIINEVDGVRVNVDRAFTDYMYPAPNDEYQTINFPAGPQTMDGETALKFVRSRHGNNGEGSDFARSERQQKIILALKEKVLSFGILANPVRIKRVMDTLERHMTTNMKFEEILHLVKIARELNTEEITKLVLDNSVNGFLTESTTQGGAYLLTPKTGNFNEIHEAIKNIFDPSFVPKTTMATPVQEKPSYDWAEIEIQNGTWRAGLAARLKQRLVDEEFYVQKVENVDPTYKPMGTSGIYEISQEDSTEIMQALQTELHIPIKQVPPEGIIDVATTTDILVVLGDDFIE